MLQVLLCVLLYYPALAVDPETFMGVTEIIQRWEYPVESHDVVTADGHVLELVRIPHGRKASLKKCRPAVLFVHGIFGNSTQFVLNPPDAAPAFFFADAGFDVFLASVRGSTHVKRHTSLPSNESSYWEFSMDDFVNLDAPAFVDTALRIAGKSSLYYVGHSQGVTIGLSLLAEYPSYQTKVKALFGWGSISTGKYWNGIPGVLDQILPVLRPFIEMFNAASREIAFGMPEFTKGVMEIFCSVPVIDWTCARFLMGASEAPLNASRLPVYIAQSPASTSSRNLVHWLQTFTHADANCKFDYGQLGNLVRYWQLTPPVYNYAKIETPVYFFRGGVDQLANANETNALVRRFKRGVVQSVTEILSYGHVDFVIALDAPEKLYYPMLDMQHIKRALTLLFNAILTRPPKATVS